MTGEVVYLEFHSHRQKPEGMDFLACSHCRTKTFTHTYLGGNEFPLVKCAACGQHIGRVGWVCDDDPLVRSPDGESA